MLAENRGRDLSFASQLSGSSEQAIFLDLTD